MNKSIFVSAFFLFLMCTLLTSCEAIASIFKAGMGFGIFIVVALIAAAAAIVFKVSRNKNGS